MHKIYRRSQGVFYLKSVTDSNIKTNWRLIGLLPYYAIASFVDQLQLKKLQHHD